MNMADGNSGSKKLGVSFEKGWPILKESINNVIDIIEGVRLHDITIEESVRAFTALHDICQFVYNSPAICEKLYERYQKIFEDYVSSKVLPRLRGKNGKILLKELVRQWNNYKILRKWLVKFFCHLDGCYIGQRHNRSLPKTSNSVFYKLVYGEMNSKVRDAVISEINLDRKGEKIDKAVVKNAVEIYVEMAEGSMEYYEKDFETAMLADTAKFYAQKAAEWHRIFEEEKIRVFNYLKPGSYVKIMTVMEDEMLTVLAPEVESNSEDD